MLLGVLLAGVVVDVLGYVAWVLFLGKMEAALWTGYTNINFFGGFILGFVSVGLYAAIRPRYGPGPKTAVLSGLLCCFALGVVPMLIDAFWHGLLLPVWFLAIAFGTVFVIVVIATLAGAWVYNGWFRTCVSEKHHTR